VYEYILTLARGGFLLISVTPPLGPSLVTIQVGSLVSPPYAYWERRPPGIMAACFVPVALRTCLGLLESKGNVFAPVRPWPIPSDYGWPVVGF